MTTGIMNIGTGCALMCFDVATAACNEKGTTERKVAAAGAVERVEREMPVSATASREVFPSAVHDRSCFSTAACLQSILLAMRWRRCKSGTLPPANDEPSAALRRLSRTGTPA